MDDKNLEERKQGTHSQQQFRNAGNANVIQQAGEGLAEARSSTPVPGDRLTADEVNAEAGGRTDQGDPISGKDADRQVDSSAKAEEREALRRQGQNETDSDLDRPNRAQGSTALEDPV